MKTAEAIKHFGNATKLAEALGCGKSTISMWGDEPPYGRQCELQVITRGKLKAARKYRIINPR